MEEGRTMRKEGRRREIGRREGVEEGRGNRCFSVERNW